MTAEFAKGAQRFSELRKAGKIKVVTGKTGYSHTAGRLEDRSPEGTREMERAAQQGMEFGQTYHHEEENNSPSALDMATMVKFQQVFYQVLAAAKGHPAQELAQQKIAGRAKWMPKEPHESKGEKKKDDESASVSDSHKATLDDEEELSEDDDEVLVDTAADWAKRHAGHAEYGQSDGNNCLIYAIGFSLLGHRVTDILVSRIRASIDLKHMGAERGHMLAPTEHIIQHIQQLIYAALFEEGRVVHPVQIVIETAVAGAATVKVGNSGPVINIFHDGNHYWWLS